MESPPFKTGASARSPIDPATSYYGSDFRQPGGTTASQRLSAHKAGVLRTPANDLDSSKSVLGGIRKSLAEILFAHHTRYGVSTPPLERLPNKLPTCPRNTKFAGPSHRVRTRAYTQSPYSMPQASVSFA